jgi:hypothetical protein
MGAVWPVMLLLKVVRRVMLMKMVILSVLHVKEKKIMKFLGTLAVMLHRASILMGMVLVRPVELFMKVAYLVKLLKLKLLFVLVVMKMKIINLLEDSAVTLITMSFPMVMGSVRVVMK